MTTEEHLCVCVCDEGDHQQDQGNAGNYGGAR